MIKIPVPHFVTFYNGLEKWVEDEDEIRLSDMYEIPTDNPELELKVRVININEDVHILNKCKTLRDYMTFVNKVRFKMGVEGDNVRIAVTEAMNECIDEDILVDFFEQHREEVVEVSIYDYDEEDVRRTLFEEAKEMAKEELKETEPFLKTLNSELTEIITYTLPIENSKRTILKITKQKPPPSIYPRNYSQIKKSLNKKQ